MVGRLHTVVGSIRTQVGGGTQTDNESGFKTRMVGVR